MYLMTGIITSAKDVSLLNSEGIVQRLIESDKALAEMFNRLSKDLVLDPGSSLDNVHRMVSGYCQKPWRRLRANLVRTYAYFRSPLAAVPLAAASILLFLTDYHADCLHRAVVLPTEQLFFWAAAAFSAVATLNRV
ncbi:hypothetical protein ACMD2_12635 [Ananas comosus]|uniref:Uncharacterized protein n=1 Tax=Ananas comosus TaxID=4615 RepID=A0A199UZK1_ANACO|nr:hypothetical protein ACMD2_12635 [Ananas comosus]